MAKEVTKEQLEAALKSAQETVLEQKKLIDEDKDIAKNRRDRLKVLLQRTETCSGSCRVQLRQFIEIIDTARRYSQATDAEVIPQVMSLVTDPLRSGIDSHIRDKPNVDWQEVRAFIVKQYLEQDESHYLLQLVDSTKQTYTEDVRAYCLRFLEHAEHTQKKNLARDTFNGIS